MKTKFEIWQLPLSSDYKFKYYDWLDRKPTIRDYVMVYAGEREMHIDDVNEYLETLFYIFNQEHPEDYHAASMSVSDLVCLIDKYHKRTWYYVDGLGFKEVEMEG